MTLISVKFLAITATSLLVYYILPLRFRWMVLLLGSIVFYAFGGTGILTIVLLSALLAYVGAILLEKSKAAKKAKLVLTIFLLLFLGIWGFVKLGQMLWAGSAFLIVPVGISYYTLSIIGYLLDVYWGRERAERNFFHFALFILFFPKILQGPIARHRHLALQLVEGHRFDYQKFCFGLQLVLWGLFKKLVVADRASIFVNAVYGDVYKYEHAGGMFFIAMLLSALYMYADFSGYTDIVLGVAELFGVEMEPNFNHPFFSRSASEWWQRWHMTLSGWFKDYLFMPVSRSQFVKKWSKRMGNRYGAVVRKKTVFVISCAVVWAVTGLWHGTGANYVLWGAYWGGIIIFSEVFKNQLEGLTRILHINTDAPSWRVIQMLRTTAIFIVGRAVSALDSVQSLLVVAVGIFKHFSLSDFGMVLDEGLTEEDFVVILLGVAIMFIVSLLQEKGIKLRQEIAGWNAIPRWIFYSLAVSFVLLVGVYGAEYDVSTFAYQVF